MVTDVQEAPATEPVVTDPEPQEDQTEVTPTEPVGDDAAETPEAAAVPQVEVVEEKPNYVTREELEEERKRAAAQALEDDRRRRQTENARRAQQEERQKLRVQQTVDTVRASLVSRGIDPDVATDETVIRTIDRVAQERAEGIVKEHGNLVGEAWDYLTAPVYGKEADLDDSFAAVARELGPKVQHLIDSIRPQIETAAAKAAIAEYEKNVLPKKIEADRAAVAARGREGQEELKRPEGQPSTVDKNSLGYWETRIAHEGEEGHPDLSPADWAAYRQIRRQHGFS